MRKKITFKIALSGILCALGLIAFMLESLLPPLILPGAKLGLSNIFILLAVVLLGWQYAFAVLLIKTILGSLFSGNVSALLYSLPSGIIALTTQVLMLYFIKKISIVAVSICGGVINTIVQNLVFCFVNNTISYMAYSPYLSLLGIVSGAVVGFIVYLIVIKLPNRFTGV